MSSMMKWLRRFVSKEKPIGVSVDNLAVGKKLLVRTKAHTENRMRPEEDLYTIERREDGLYISGYGYGTETARAAVAAAGGIELQKLWWKCRGIGYEEGYKMKEENILIIGKPMVFRIDDVYHGEGKHSVHTDAVVEITEGDSNA